MLNIIIDLDSTLIHSIENVDDTYYIANVKWAEMFTLKLQEKSNTKKSKKHHKKTKKKQNIVKVEKVKEKLVFKRSYLNIFLRYCFKHFNVGFWSLGETTYVHGILKKILLPEEYKKSICIISRHALLEDAVVYKDSVNKKTYKIPYINDKTIKELTYIYNNKITSKNTLLLDDSLIHKGINPRNTILIPAYEYSIVDDRVLYILVKEFDKIKHRKRIDTLPIQKLEEKLFKGYKVNKKSSVSLPHYKEGDIVFDTEDTLNAYNNDIVILDVYKHTYKIMYVEEDSKKVVTKVLPKSAIAYKYLVN
jgi:hypothetical protein